MSGLPPKPVNSVFEVRINGGPPVRTNQLIEAQWLFADILMRIARLRAPPAPA